MKRYLPWTILTALLILLPIQAARAAGVTEIDDDEYAVYDAALGNLDTVFVSPVRCRSVFHETLSKHKLNAESIAELARQGSAPDLTLIEDFNLKNARSALIAAGDTGAAQQAIETQLAHAWDSRLAGLYGLLQLLLPLAIYLLALWLPARLNPALKGGGSR